MKQDSLNYDDEPVVLPDECGDTLWDVVLQQEAKDSALKGAGKNTASLLSINIAKQKCEVTNV